MRVALLSTTDCEGGAARAAMRLHRALRGAGVDSTYLVQCRTSSEPGIVEAPVRAAPGRQFWPLLQQWLIDTRRAGDWNTHFSHGLPGTDLSHHPAILEADVVHLHWTSEFLSPIGVAGLLGTGKPVVWTLHDERAFTGGCHYAFECRGFETDCAACPQLRQESHELPAALLSDSRTLLPPEAFAIVTPSRWLADEARRSALFRTARITVIPNALETDLFRPMPRAEARGSLGLAPDSLALLFGADFGAERRKGFRELVEALQFCACDDAFRSRCREGRITLLCFGHPGDELASLPMRVQALGYVRDDAALARAYSAADLFLLPSLADNLPCTMAESMSCGTPVAAFAAGGIPDGVEDGVTGRLAPVGDTRRLAQAILDLTADEPARTRMGQAARELAASRYACNVVAEQHRRLYAEIIAQPHRPAAVPPETEVGPNLAARLSVLGRQAVAHQSESDPTNKRWRWLRRRVERLGDARSDLNGWLREFDRLTAVSNQPKRSRYWDDFASCFRRR